MPMGVSVSSNTFARRSRALCEPAVTKIYSGVVGIPFCLRSKQSCSRKGPKPSVSEYCKAFVPKWSKALHCNSAKRLIGKLSGAGLPPAKEIIPGVWRFFSISRIALERIRWVRCDIIWVPCLPAWGAEPCCMKSKKTHSEEQVCARCFARA